MRSAGQAVALAVPFVWLGMVLAISFLEAPLKFRAPGITLPLGLGIGRLIFRALNLAEIGLALLLTIAGLAAVGSFLLWIRDFRPDVDCWRAGRMTVPKIEPGSVW